MSNEEKQSGPEMINLPMQRKRVCGGCQYHDRQRMVCGHDYVTNNYKCLHPDVEREGSSIFGPGRMIAYNSREEPSTPAWCPFLKLIR